MNQMWPICYEKIRDNYAHRGATTILIIAFAKLCTTFDDKKCKKKKKKFDEKMKKLDWKRSVWMRARVREKER